MYNRAFTKGLGYDEGEVEGEGDHQFITNVHEVWFTCFVLYRFSLIHEVRFTCFVLYRSSEGEGEGEGEG